MSSAGRAAPTRRERLRLATVAEIKGLARTLLLHGGPGAISLRAIARQMGMTAPAIYRYFPSLDALVTDLAEDIYDECRVQIEAARDTSGDPVDQLLAMARALRRWALDHPAEFGLILGSPVPGVVTYDVTCGVGDTAAKRYGVPWISSFAAAWQTHHFATPPHELIVARLGDVLEPAVAHESELPPEVLYAYLSAWMRLYGFIAMEAFGHLQWAVRTMEPLFETELGLMAAQLRGEP